MELRFKSKIHRYREFDALYEVAYKKYNDPATTSDDKIVWERALIGFGQSKEKAEELVKILLADEGTAPRCTYLNFNRPQDWPNS